MARFKKRRFKRRGGKRRGKNVVVIRTSRGGTRM